MPKRTLDLRWLAIGVLALNLGALGTHAWLSVQGGPRPIPRGAQLIRPAGRTAEGLELTDDDFAGHPCHIIRYESTRCPHCETDRPILGALLRDAAGRSCTVTFLAPTPEERIEDAPNKAGHLLDYPSVAFVRSFPAAGTPTTVVADSRWRVVWSKTAALREGDPRAAMNALD